MPRGVKKEHLPSKVCVVCERPFTWRKKWERCWDEVTTCSKSCNAKRRSGNRAILDDDDDDDDDEKDRPLSNDKKSSKKKNANKGAMVENAEVVQGSTSTSRFEVGESINECLDQDEIFDMNDELDVLTLEELFDEANSNAHEDDDANNVSIMDQVAREKAARKAAKKVKKAERRAQREGNGDPMAGRKTCDMCSKSVNLLVRCTYDESLQWKMVCGTCWKNASGGVVDGDTNHPFYRYGGLWKNRRAHM
ncbi:hypothetical protein MHU86_18025 [Fragilaria crotonensis]|nr:hypothetical protein MHU86_18025 [Fragilaria crotonensis]